MRGPRAGAPELGNGSGPRQQGPLAAGQAMVCVNRGGAPRTKEVKVLLPFCPLVAQLTLGPVQ